MKNNQSVQATYMAFIWHGTFLALTMSMLDLNTVFPALVSELSGSKLLFGFLYSIMLGAPLVFNIVFSHFLKAYAYKKKFLLGGIYVRALSFLGMALFTYFFGASKPLLVVLSFFLWIFLFSVSGGFAGIVYSDLVAKLLESRERTQLFAMKQFFSSVAALGGGLLISRIFASGKLAFPTNYALSLAIGFVGLSIAALGFVWIKEPASEIEAQTKESFRTYLGKAFSYIREDLSFRRFIVVENLSSFSTMALPFYMIYAKEIFSLDNQYLGQFLLFQISGTIASNFMWTYLARRHNSRVIVQTCIFIGGILPLLALALGQTNPDLFSIVFLFLGFVVSGRRVGFEPFLLDIAPAQYRTEYLGIRGSLNLFTVILPILGGLFIETIGYLVTFLVVFGVMMVAFGIAIQGRFLECD